MRVHGVATGEHATGDQHHVADLQSADLLVRDRRGQPDLPARHRKSSGRLLRRQHRHRRHVAVAIQPRRNRAGLRVESDTKTTKGPAVVGNRHEEAGGQAVERRDLAADQRRAAAKPHRTDGELVGGRHDRCFELRQSAVGIDVVERAKELFLRVQIPRRTVAADADANGARAAALALRLPDRVEDALAHPVERAVGAAEMIELGRQRVLRVGVLAAAALEDQLDLDLVGLPLLEVHDWRSRSEVVAGVLTGDRVDAVGPQLSASRRLGDGGAICCFIQIWLAPTGTRTSKVGIPVS